MSLNLNYKDVLISTALINTGVDESVYHLTR